MHYCILNWVTKFIVSKKEIASIITTQAYMQEPQNKDMYFYLRCLGI